MRYDRGLALCATLTLLRLHKAQLQRVEHSAKPQPFEFPLFPTSHQNLVRKMVRPSIKPALVITPLLLRTPSVHHKHQERRSDGRCSENLEVLGNSKPGSMKGYLYYSPLSINKSPPSQNLSIKSIPLTSTGPSISSLRYTPTPEDLQKTL